MRFLSHCLHMPLLCALVTFQSSACLALGEATAPQNTSTVTHNETWRVHVTSVERRDSIFEDTKPQRAVDGREFIRVGVRLEYLGPEARLRPPKVALIDKENTRYPRVPNAVGERTAERKPNDNFVKSIWFNTELEKRLAAGEAMPDTLWFDFDVPKGTHEYRFAFGEVEPIRLTED